MQGSRQVLLLHAAARDHPTTFPAVSVRMGVNAMGPRRNRSTGERSTRTVLYVYWCLYRTLCRLNFTLGEGDTGSWMVGG